MKRSTFFLFIAMLLALAACNGDKIEQQREQYMEEVQLRLKVIEDKILALRERVELPETLNKEQFRAGIDALGKVQNQAEQKLEELKSTGDAEWQRVKAELDSLMTVVERTYENTRSY